MMRTTATLGLVLLLGGLAAPAIPRAQSRADVALREAIETETVKGDIRKALEQYRKLADGKDRAAAAQALLRMARIYELLRSPEARKTYERIAAQFSDQKEVAEKARAQLRASDGKPAAMAQQVVWNVPRVGPAREGVASPEAGEGSVSSDGRSICYTVDTADGSYLAVRDLTSGNDRVLTNAPKADSGEGCSFSPSGDHIAYTWHDPGDGNDWELRVVGLSNGAAPRTLLKSSSTWYGTPAWSPDGRSIAIQEVEGNERTGRFQALLVSLQDGSSRTLPSPGGWRMFFSPDGRYLALDHRPMSSIGPHDVFVLSMEDNREVNVTEYPSDDRVMGWSPDSSRVLFSSDRSDTTGLYAVSIAEGRRQGAPALLKADLGNAAPMGVSTSGALYYHARSGGATQFLETMECDSTAARCGATPVTLGPANRMALAWAPDNRYLAYLSPGTPSSGGGPTLKIRSVDGTSVRDVSAAELPLGGTVDMRWAPDGRTVAVATMMGGRLALVNVEGQRAEVTWSGRVGSGPISGLAWSPDQRKLYYRTGPIGANRDSILMERDLASQGEREVLRRSGPAIGGWSLSRDGQSILAMVNDAATQTSELLTIPLAGGEPQVIARRPAMGGVYVSPDGRSVATVSRIASEKTTAILLIATAGGEVRELIRATQPAAVRDLMWAPDGQSVYFRRRDSTTQNTAALWRVSLDTGEARRVEGAVDTEMALPVALSPDGRRLAFLKGDGGGQPRSEVWKLENFFAALTAK